MIFLSSTVDDMQDERNAITEVVSTLQQQISRCEYFPARTESPKEVCLEVARNCDIFLGIYKKRYGFVPKENNPENISVTHMEYIEAKKSNRKICIFISAQKEAEKDLTEFLDTVKNFSKGHFVKTYHNIDELKYLIAQSLYNLKNIPSLTENEKKAIEDFMPDVKKYRESILQRYEFNSIKGIARKFHVITYKIDDLYIPPELSRYADKKKSEDEMYFSELAFRSFPPLDASMSELEHFLTTEKKVSNLITTGIDIKIKLEAKTPLVILGEPGSGKSTLLKILACKVVDDTPTIPFFIQIRDFIQYVNQHKDDSIIEFLKNQHNDLNLSNNFFNQQLVTGSCLILFDGLDEVWNLKDRNHVNNIIEKFCSMWSSHNKIIITSRFSGYEQNPLSGNLEILKLVSFNYSKITSFVENWNIILSKSSGTYEQTNIEKITSEITSVIFSSEELTELAKNPLLLLIICLVYSNSGSVPEIKSGLYRTLVDTLLAAWEKSKGIELDKFGQRDFEELFKEIAFYMFVNKKTELTLDELFRVITKQLNLMGLTDCTNIDIENLINYFEDRTGILINNGSGIFSFYHLSFLEYFAALKIASNFDVNKMYEFFKDDLHTTHNSEIISFLTASIDTRINTSKFLEMILNTKTDYEDIHLLDFLLIIKSLISGALITDEFKKIIFSKIAKEWNERRHVDNTFFHMISQLIRTPYKNDLNILWRQKCNENDRNYIVPYISSNLIFQNQNFDKFSEYWAKQDELDKKYESSWAINLLDLVKRDLDNKQFIFFLEHFEEIKSEPISSLLIFDMAKRTVNDKNLEKWYFEKMKKTSDMQMCMFIRYSSIINQAKYDEVLKYGLTHIKSEQYLKELKNFDMRNTVTRIDFQQQVLDKLIDKNIDKNIEKKDEEMLGSWILSQSIFDFYDKQFVQKLIEILEKLPSKYTILAFRIYDVFDHLVQKTNDFSTIIKSIFESDAEKFQRWQNFSLAVKLRLYSPDDDTKKKLIGNVRNKTLYEVHRRKDFSLLIEYFDYDDEVKKLVEDIIYDDKVGYNALIELSRHPEHAVSLLKKLICFYNETDSKELLQGILESIRIGIATRSKNK